MRVFAITLSHGPKEFRGITCRKASLIIVKFVLRFYTLVNAIIIATFTVPVHQNINIVSDSRLYDRVHLCGIIFRTSLVIPLSPISNGTHCRANKFNIPLAYKRINKGIAVERHSVWPKDTPGKAHSAHLNFGSIFDALHASINAAFASGILAGLQSTVLTYGTYARGLNCCKCATHKGKRTQGDNRHF